MQRPVRRQVKWFGLQEEFWQRVISSSEPSLQSRSPSQTQERETQPLCLHLNWSLRQVTFSHVPPGEVSSSDWSGQSKSPSHKKRFSMHVPLRRHWNSCTGSQVGFSSLVGIVQDWLFFGSAWNPSRQRHTVPLGIAKHRSGQGFWLQPFSPIKNINKKLIWDFYELMNIQESHPFGMCCQIV